jgi:AmmeMemoRadiSam system protein B/AmmeMemoRadiSam system protein A
MQEGDMKKLAGLFVLVLFLSACCPAPTPPTSATSFPSSTVLPGQVRRSVVAGSWYPGDPDELTRMVDGMLAAVEPVDGEPIGLIVPHAGYAYSGQVAAYGFKQLEGVAYDVAVIIAADHQPPLSNPISVWAGGGFETPLGVVPVDVGLAQALIAADPRITFDPAAHEGEHMIEIELPFLQRVCPGCRIVPVLMGNAEEETVEALAGALLKVLPGKRAVVIASSDLSHYPAYEDALTVDGTTLGAIETFDPAQVRAAVAASMAKRVPNLATCACGEGAILVTMRVAAGLGADTVVGYGAVMFWRYESPDLTESQQEKLLTLARSTLESYLSDGTIPAHETDDPVLARRSGAFVTLKEKGELRGCIGHLRADLPLYQAVQQMAVAAATEDPRFPPLTLEELADVTIEISVLSPFRRLTAVEQIEVGTHGLVIVKGGRQGLLLPQVPVEQGWDREEFLDNLCLKAGLETGCWRENATLYTFTAVVFGEE